MRQGLDIADVEERTKIRAKYLRALENEEWGLLPGHTFVKTFLRTYAEQVGIDPHLLVEEYRLSHESEEPDVQPLASAPVARRRDPRVQERSPAGPRSGPAAPGRSRGSGRGRRRGLPAGARPFRRGRAEWPERLRGCVRRRDRDHSQGAPGGAA